MSEALKNDIAYMKAMAEDGGRQPIRGGSALFWAGLCFGGVSLVHYGFITGYLPMPTPWIISASWLLAGVLYALLTVISIRASIVRYGSGGAMNRLFGSVWSMTGMSIFVIAMCLLLAGSRLGQANILIVALAPTVLVLYGVAWWVSAVISGQNWLKWVCFGTFGGAVLTALTANQPEQFLVYALCLILFATLPGLKLMSAERG